MSPVVEPIWAWPVVVLVSAGMLATVLWTYFRGAGLQVRMERPGRWRWLIGLRLLAWAILTFAMFRPAIEWSREDDRPAVLRFLLDASRSGSTKDGPSNTTRREHILKTLKDIEPELKAFPAQTQIEFVDFDRDLRPVKAPAPKTPGEQTALGAILETTANQLRGKRVLSVLLLSDGAFRALPPYDLEPQTAARKLADNEIRLDTVPYGTTALAEAALDVVADDLSVSPTVFVKNKVVVSTKIRTFGAAQRDITVRLMIEEPGERKPGQPPRMKLAAPAQRIRPTQPSQVTPVEFEFIAENPGEWRLTLEAVPLQGEQQVTNNELTTYITVLKGGIRVAYFDTVRPEQKWIRRVDESPDIQLDFQEIRRIPAGAVTKIDPAFFEPGKYDVYIIGDVPASVFGDELLSRMAKLVEAGSGLMMLGGFRSFGAGGYANSPLAQWLPIRMRPTDVANGGSVDPNLHLEGLLPMQPVGGGLQHFVMRLDDPAKNAATWKQLPPLTGANRFGDRLKAGAIPLAQAGPEQWLLVSMEVGRSRSMAFAGDTTYLWPQAGFLELHQRFWQQCILWLAHKDVQGDTSIWVKLDNRRFRPGQPVDFTLGARDADKRPIPDADFSVQVVGPKEKTFALTPQRAAPDALGKFLETQQPGEYRIVVGARHNDKSLGIPAEARFVVYEQDLELHNPAADPVLLQELARLTGGQYVPPDQLKAHLKNLQRESLSRNYRQVKLITLWDNWVLLVVFVGVLTGEWVLRKRSGLV